MRSYSGKRGFTLIELVVVLAIIAALAGLVIPQISSLGRTSDMATSAGNQAELANNLQLFFVLQKRFPQGMDSLITTGGAIYNAGTSSASPLSVTNQTLGLPLKGIGIPAVNIQSQLTVSALTSPVSPATTPDFLRSFTRCGFDFVYDHDVAVVNSNNSGTTQRLLTTAPVNVAEVTGADLIARLCPQGLLPTERLVALGIGPKNAAISKTIINCPTYNGADGKYYGRYIAVFKVYASGERAVLVAVIDCYGRTPDYTQQQFNESLPDGGRQG